MIQKTEALRVRLTQEEAEAFKEFAASKGENRGRLLRKMIRESINGQPDFLTDEEAIVKIALRQLFGITHNLNQITKAIHEGKANIGLDTAILKTLGSSVMEVKNSIQDYVVKTKTRWVKDEG